jgi:hypothetical protein
MLAALRNQHGRPNARVRAAALVLVAGLVLATAPFVVGPVVVAGWHSLVTAFPGF